METIKHLANNQIVVCYNNGYKFRYKFFSYGTSIATYYSDVEDNQRIELTNYYDYSRTTSKWLKVFLQDYCNFYYDNTNELRKIIRKGGCDNVTI